MNVLFVVAVVATIWLLLGVATVIAQILAKRHYRRRGLALARTASTH